MGSGPDGWLLVLVLVMVMGEGWFEDSGVRGNTLAIRDHTGRDRERGGREGERESVGKADLIWQERALKNC